MSCVEGNISGIRHFWFYTPVFPVLVRTGLLSRFNGLLDWKNMIKSKVLTGLGYSLPEQGNPL
jgi:hypothetical protein